MAIHLRQICLVADRLAPAVDDLRAVFSIPVCHVDPGVGKFGLENALLAVGTQFLEVVAPLRDGTAAGRFLQRRGGNGGYMVICQAASLEEQAGVRARARENGVRVAYESDRGTWNIMQLHPADMGASFFEVDWDEQSDPVGNWQPAGGREWMEAVNTEVVSAIAGVELQGEDPQALAERWSAVAGVPLEHRDAGPVLPLANAELRFVHGNGGLAAVDLRVADRDRLLEQAEARGASVSDSQVLICGTRFNILR